jgi:hypothetical protein
MYSGESTRSTNTDAALIGTGPARVGAMAGAAVVGAGAMACGVGVGLGVDCTLNAGEHAAVSRARLKPSASRTSSRRLKRVTVHNVTRGGCRAGLAGGDALDHREQHVQVDRLGQRGARLQRFRRLRQIGCC